MQGRYREYCVVQSLENYQWAPHVQAYDVWSYHNLKGIEEWWVHEDFGVKWQKPDIYDFRLVVYINNASYLPI